MKRSSRRTSSVAAVGALALSLAMGGSRPARADVAAAYLEGHGGVSSTDSPTRTSSSATSSGSGVAPGLGFQVGARLLIFEGYYDRTAFGQGASVARGILGIRAGLGAGDLRLILRGGGGIIMEQGGALTGAQLGLGDRRGVVARAGVALEKKLSPGKLLAGLGIDGEVFSLQNSGTSDIADRTQGADVFVSLHLKFELGI